MRVTVRVPPEEFRICAETVSPVIVAPSAAAAESLLVLLPPNPCRSALIDETWPWAVVTYPFAVLKAL